jgi:hypothetical protein
MPQLYSSHRRDPRPATNWFSTRHALVVQVMAASLVMASTAHAESDPFKPVTADDSCEFGYRVTGPKAWESPEANGPGGWIDFVLRKAIQYCKDGDQFMIIRGEDHGGIMMGWIHDYFSVAALLCRRGDIKEENPLNRLGEKRHKFSCPITKIEALKRKSAEGKLLYRFPEDWVDPRPGDTGAMRRAPGSTQPPIQLPPAAKSSPAKSGDCKDPKAPLYAERCGIPLVAPTPDKLN